MTPSRDLYVVVHPVSGAITVFAFSVIDAALNAAPKLGLEATEDGHILRSVKIEEMVAVHVRMPKPQLVGTVND